MSPRWTRPRQAGFTMIEILVAIGLLSIFVSLSLVFSDSINRTSRLSRTATTRDRILSGVRNVAGMTASLRASARASLDGGGPVNLDLYNCVGSSLVNSCKNNQEYPLTLFSPAISFDSSGNPLGLLPVTSFRGSTTILHFDSFGVPCDVVGLDCPFDVYTTFRPQCPPPTLPATPPPTSDPAYLAYFTPMSDCTIAETVTVIYTVEVNPAAIAANPELSSFSTPFSGSVTSSVKPIFGNDPQ